MSNKKDYTRKEAIAKLQELVDDINICLFCTQIKTDDGSTCRPMGTQKADDEGNIWFFSPKDSDKNREVQMDSKVQLIYSHPGKSSYMVVNGEASVHYDREKIHELWSPIAKAWFTEGKDDPRISLIKVKVTSAYYWDTVGNNMINFFKMIASAATGTTLVDAEEGRLQVK
jgi:general stress protein 26